MSRKGRKYIYISNLNFSGTVFQTQVLDWLHLYRKHGLEFDLIQAYHIKDLKRPGYLRNQLSGIRKSTPLFSGSLYFFPGKSFLYVFNTLFIFFKISRYIFKYHEILIFSRALIGKEIAFLKILSPVKIIFYFDARAASAEENKYIAVKKNEFHLKKYKTIANIYYLEYKTLTNADRVFVVSKVLQKYFQETFKTDNDKFVLYHCLSDSDKFYFTLNARSEVRSSLKIEDQTRVFIYSGGISSSWHVTEKMFAFINQLCKVEKDLLFICLTKDTDKVENILIHFPDLKSNTLSFHVPNNEVYKYLNAADFGILFRENTVMNNVASPTKFAEYMLCGLPVLISEGVGDYTDYTIIHNVGLLIEESDLENPEKYDFKFLLEKSYDRAYIADNGRRDFSKTSIINSLLAEFKS